MPGYQNYLLNLLIATTAFTISASAQARPPGGGGMEIDQRLLERAADDLGLSDDVLEKVKSASYEADRAAIDIRSKLDRARLDFQNLMGSDNPAEQKVLALVEEMGQLETTMRKNRVGLLLKVRALLSKEQRQKLKKLMRKERKKQRGERREERRGQRRGQRQGGDSMDFDTSNAQESTRGGRGASQRRR